MTTSILSFGGGVQSVAIACLMLQGKIKKTDIAIFVDTGREKSSTLEYYNQYLANQFPLTIIKAKDWLSAKDFDVVIEQENRKDVRIPAFTETGKMRSLCSNRWKVMAIRRFLRHLGVKNADMLLGISADESKRVRLSDVGWLTNYYPLIDGLFSKKYSDLVLRRLDCFKVIQDFGLPPAPKSSCYICPNMRPQEWVNLPTHDLEKAIAVEKDMQERTRGHLQQMPYLTNTKLPLTEAIKKYKQDLELAEKQGVFEMSECSSGYCFT